VSNHIWTLRVIYFYRNPITLRKIGWQEGDGLINKAAGREPVGSGHLLATYRRPASERDLEYEFKTFPAASRAMQRISKLQWIKGITLNRERTSYQ